ncbi:ammonia-forming cytochrome c nitrite reductase [Porphyromonas sp. COT-290 OH3588]|uniref:ammonia-forming cytochrome c nitrite reductase n=1 Tax=Porphyromonas sp. COT-290 OH3588 TaxID=1515617 RepID=UPI00052C1F85|nr:ammonia-forming cytochrome c nitrite reductase [Porphyromonas sp. COT-290 OH3588]KGO01518.1 cytochrome C nitrite reductase [Porphyromonas sp. COT-290 OH3588]
MKRNLKPWQSWALFGGSMIVVFFLGLCVSALMERRAEVASIYNNRKTKMKGIVARNDLFRDDFPRQYQTWTETAQTDFKSEFNGSEAVDVLAQRPEMVILWAGYAFSKDYTTPRGHMHAVEDVTRTLRVGSPTFTGKEPQPATCWVCKSPDVPRMMQELGVAEFYKNKWSDMGEEIVNPIGCSDCHDSETMNLHISRPALVEAFERQGRDISKATPQEMRSLVCAQCHVEYYFRGDGKYLTFPWDKGFTMEDMEAYYDDHRYYDYIHTLSKAPILKAQHPDYEISQMGIHGQRGVSCADCHMPYKSEGGLKFSDHHIQSPLNMIDRTCQVCHRESEETLRNNVYERQRKANETRNRLEQELAKAHLEAQFAWQHGAKEEQMHEALQLIRQAQWRWDFGVASHGASFHAPQEIQRILSHGLDRAQQARLAIHKVLANNGYVGDVPLPDVSTKAKAQKYIGLDMEAEESAKEQFMHTTVPEWLAKAKAVGKLADA